MKHSNPVQLMQTRIKSGGLGEGDVFSHVIPADLVETNCHTMRQTNIQHNRWDVQTRGIGL